MKKFTSYRCDGNSNHPIKLVVWYALTPPHCCGKPMVRVNDNSGDTTEFTGKIENDRSKESVVIDEDCY